MIVLFYHLVSDRELPHIRHLYRYKTRRAFEADLNYLTKNYHALSHRDIIERITKKLPFPSNSVLLTFDDGYAECFSVARPLLLKYQVPAVFFVPSEVIDNKHLCYRNRVSLCIDQAKKVGQSGLPSVLRKIETLTGSTMRDRFSLLEWIGSLSFSEEATLDEVCRIVGVDAEEYLKEQRPYLTTAEIARLASDGFTVGGHGKRHTPLNFLSQDDLEEEIVSSCVRIREITGQELVPFAFPFSGLELDPAWLEKLLGKHPFITLIFGARPVKGNKRVIPYRLWADTPNATGGRKTNLPRLLESAVSPA